jgi:hypothetical protein
MKELLGFIFRVSAFKLFPAINMKLIISNITDFNNCPFVIILFLLIVVERIDNILRVLVL